MTRCRRCRKDRPTSAFTTYGAKEHLCRKCKNAAGKAYRDRKSDNAPLGCNGYGGRPDREDWHALRKPWPFPAGSTPFAY